MGSQRESMTTNSNLISSQPAVTDGYTCPACSMELLMGCCTDCGEVYA